MVDINDIYISEIITIRFKAEFLGYILRPRSQDLFDGKV
jgi:hypothetical protein